MSAVVVIGGGIVLVIALAGFYRSLWRPAPKRDRDETSPDGLPPGGTGGINPQQ